MKKSEEMFRIVEAYATSGMSRDKYADSIGISRSKMQYWCKRYAERTAAVSSSPLAAFVELSAEEPSSSPSRIVIVLPSGTRIEVS